MSSSSNDKYIGESGRPFPTPTTSTIPASSTFQGENFIKILNETDDFFNRNEDNYAEHNRFLERFIDEWLFVLNEGRYKQAEQIWDSALDKAKQWENRKGKAIHKGVIYYFWAVTCILKQDLEKGFLLMHQALEEDKNRASIIDLKKTPSYAFVTLDYEQQRQFFKEKVEEIADFVENQLSIYQSKRAGLLSISDLRSKFLSASDPVLLDVVFTFVFQLFHIKKLLAESTLQLTQNVYGSLLLANTLFSICLVIEGAVKFKHPSPISKRYPVLLNFLLSKTHLTLTQKILEELNEPFQNNFSNTLKALINCQYTISYYTFPPDSIEEDLALTYGFRNLGAHRIENQPVIYENFKEIIARVLNVLFFAIEKLY